MAEIGATLRAARMSARIDVSEIEAQTKIRAKYLRALENEEWDLLPGPTFVRSFLRTYAQALGLDAKVLVEEYRLNNERPSEAALEPIVSAPRGASGSRGRVPPRPSRGYMAIVGAVGVVIVLLIVGLLSGGGGGSSKTSGASARVGSTQHNGKHEKTPHTSHPASVVSTRVALSLRPSALVYVCLIDNDNGRKLIPGLELKPGTSTPTYHAKRFTITLGNSSVTMFVDGARRTVAPSSAAIGYSVTKAGRQRLKAGQLPTCA
ncbi:MAG TPA: helix-turn-helix transcriptional regulator [Solirubrobacteraceae bacterium]|nr:helix-turn-helix transcriptional regulator [Solirubrobacteraceae bacterium]